MQDQSQSDASRAATIVEEALKHVAERFDKFPELHHRIVCVTVMPDPMVASGIRLVPPGPSNPVGTVVFDPEQIIELTREHKHPEWVVCARLERMILAACDEWESDDNERKQLVAHREERRARSASVRSRD